MSGELSASVFLNRTLDLCPLQNLDMPLVLHEYTAGLCVAFNDRVVSMPVQLFLQSAVVMKLVGGGLVAHQSNLGAAGSFPVLEQFDVPADQYRIIIRLTLHDSTGLFRSLRIFRRESSIFKVLNVD